MTRTVGLALLGYGTVGQGVADLVETHRGRWAAQLGCDAVLRHVVVRDVSLPRDVPVPASACLGSDPAAAVQDPAVDVVVEVNGAVEPNRVLLGEALRRGVHVVTANKALLSAHLEELTAAAQEGGAALLYDAAVAGGVPVVRALRDLALVDTVTAVSGVLNGSCNHILTAMAHEGASYEEAVGRAQALGYLEADPSADVAGWDAQRKLRILATLAFGGRVPEEGVVVTGIDRVRAEDITALRAVGREIRLLGEAALAPGAGPQERSPSVRAVVEPVAVPGGGAWAGITGSTNAVSLEAAHVGRLAFAGPGAGRYETASAVVTDLVDVLAGAPTATPLGERDLRVLPEAELRGRWYVRAGAQEQALAPLLETVLTQSPLTGVTRELTRSSLAAWLGDPASAVIRWSDQEAS